MSRVKSVDALRVAAIIAVIAIHTRPFESPSLPIGRTLDLATTVNQLARFAVPLFFILSGYFWANKFKDNRNLIGPTLKIAKKLVILFLAWSVIYLIPANIIGTFSFGVTGPIKQTYWNFVGALSNPMTTLMQGTKVHLWFLVGLLCSLSISALLLRFNLSRLLAAVAVAFYVLGLAGKAYSDTPLGFHSSFNFRNGPFFSLIFFVTGYFIQRREPSEHRLLFGFLFLAFGALCHFSELLILNEVWGTTLGQDYVIGTYFLGVGAALIAFSNSKWLSARKVASIGPLVLGIYASHFIFIDLFQPIDRIYDGNSTWDALYVFIVFIVFILSYALSWLLSRHHITNRLVA